MKEGKRKSTFLGSLRLSKSRDEPTPDLPPTLIKSQPLPSPGAHSSLIDTHPDAPHRRPKLDATTEIELRRACAVILRDLKPSGHDLEDTRMKQDILVEGGSDDERGPTLPISIPTKDVSRTALQNARIGHRAQQLSEPKRASRMSDKSTEPSWPLSPTLSQVSEKDKRRSKNMEVAPLSLRTKTRIDAMMLGTSSDSVPTSPLREEYHGGPLAPVQTAAVGSPRSPTAASRRERPRSGYLLEDFLQAEPDKSEAMNTGDAGLVQDDSLMSSTGSSVTRNTGSTTTAPRSASTDLSSAAFTTPGMVSNRASQGGIGSFTASNGFKTLDATDKGKQVVVPDADTTGQEQSVLGNGVVRPLSPLIPKPLSTQRSLTQLRPQPAPTRSMGTNLEAQAVPIIHSRTSSVANINEVTGVDKRSTPSEVKPVDATQLAVNDAQDTGLEVQRTALRTDTTDASSYARDEMVSPEQGTNIANNHVTPVSPIAQEQQAIQTAPVSHKDSLSATTHLATDEQSKIKEMKLVNIMDKSEEPLANPRSRMTSVSDAEQVEPPSMATSDVYAEPDPASQQDSMIPDSTPASANKTHQWPITAPVDQLTPPASDSAPTPLVMSPHALHSLTHKHDNTVFVKDFWRPSSPAQPRSASRVEKYSNTPSLRSRRSEVDIRQQSSLPDQASLPSWTAGPDTSIFNPRSASPDDPVSSMVKALPGRATSPLAGRSQSMTSLAARAENAANKTLPPLPQTPVQGSYFPSAPPVQQDINRAVAPKATVNPMTTSNINLSNTLADSRTRSLTTQPAAPNVSANSLIMPPSTSLVQTHPVISAQPSTSLFTQQPLYQSQPPPQQPLQPRLNSISTHNNTAASAEQQNHNRTASNLSQKPTPSFTRRNIPPYIPGVGHVDLSSLSGSSASSPSKAMKRTSGSTSTSHAAVPQQSKGLKGLLFKLGGGEMPNRRNGGGKGTWHAPPLVNVYNLAGMEDGWYEEDYDEQACAAPVVPFGRGW